MTCVAILFSRQWFIIFCCETFARQCRLLAVDIEEGNISPYIVDDDCFYDSSCQNAIETLKRYYTRYESVVYDHNEAYYA